MGLGLKVGDKVKVTTGKFAGKEDTVAFLDKKNKRARLDSLKKEKSKKKELHGTFHIRNLQLIKEEPAQPAPEEKAEAQEVEAQEAAPEENAATEEAKTEEAAPAEEAKEEAAEESKES